MTLAEGEWNEERSASGISESQVSEAKRTEICWTNYPRSEATWDYCMNHRNLLAEEAVSNAFFGVHTRDSNTCLKQLYEN